MYTNMSNNMHKINEAWNIWELQTLLTPEDLSISNNDDILTRKWKLYRQQVCIL